MTGAEFREMRVSIGLSQKAVAEFFGVSYRTVREWEASETVTGLVECAISFLSVLHDREFEDAA
jgi:DNA-binding transcriptional regulator YiaG